MILWTDTGIRKEHIALFIAVHTGTIVCLLHEVDLPYKVGPLSRSLTLDEVTFVDS